MHVGTCCNSNVLNSVLVWKLTDSELNYANGCHNSIVYKINHFSYTVYIKIKMP